MPGARLVPTLGGVAVVVCVHDREKRQVTDIPHVQALGRLVGVEYDPRRHKIHQCACCENLFVSDDDTPRFCTPCTAPLVHPLGGPLPDPIGALT